MAPPLFFDKALFDGQMPDISRIAAKVQELSGLAVCIRQPEASRVPDAYKLHGFIAFECAPDGEIELCAFDVAAVLGDDALREEVELILPPPRNASEWLNEPTGKQAMHIRVWSDGLFAIALDPTFLTYVLLALEALGGELDEPPKEEQRRACAAPVSELELEYRRWKGRGEQLVGVFAAGFTEPVYIMSELFGARFARGHLYQGLLSPGPIRSARDVLLRIALFPLKLVGSMAMAVFIAIVAPLGGLYLALRFAAATARLAYHRVSRRT
jgi:hypothetical protein